MNLTPDVVQTVRRRCCARGNVTKLETLASQRGKVQSDSTQIAYGEAFDSLGLSADADADVLAVGFQADTVVYQWNKSEIKKTGHVPGRFNENSNSLMARVDLLLKPFFLSLRWEQRFGV